MKMLTTLLALSLSLSAFAEEVPSYLKDGTITVTLKNGKQYTFSANEYKVVKRGDKAPEMRIPVIVYSESKQQESKPAEPKRLKHIVSGEVLQSNGGLNTSESGNSVTVKNKRQIGVGLQYQYNIYQDLYMGGRIDSNGGTGVNLGVGF